MLQQRPFLLSFIPSFLPSSFFPVRPRPSVPLFAKTNDDDGAHLLSLPRLSLCRSESRCRLLASPHLSLPSFLPSPPSTIRNIVVVVFVAAPQSLSPFAFARPLGLTHFHRNAVFASSTTTTRCGARQWHAPIDCGQILRLFRTHFVTASHSQSPMRLFVNSSEAATLCAFATMLGAKAIFLYSPFPLPLSTWMIGDSAAANSDDGFIAVIICKAAEYRTSGDVHEKEEGKDDPQMHQQHLGGTMRRRREF